MSFAIGKRDILKNIRIGNEKYDNTIQTKTYYTVSSQNGNKLDILIVLENEYGIEELTIQGETIKFNGRTKVALDRTMEEGEETQIDLKIVGQQELEVHKLVASVNPKITITNVDTNGDGLTKTVQIDYPESENINKYYSLDDGETWLEYVEPLEILAKDNKTITARYEFKENQTIYSTAELESLIVSDGLVSAAQNAVNKSKYYRIAVANEEYAVHSYAYDESQTIEKTTYFGDANDIGTASSYAKRMVIVKVNGDLTINSGVTLSAYGSAYGGPKGMLLCVTGTLTNNGTISMSARGAYAVGQNVYLWRNEDTTSSEYEYVPALGGTGGAGKRNRQSGASGASGTNRKTGGGRIWSLLG